MIVIANNMKEACQYLEEKKARNRANRINAVNIDGLCKSFTSDDYKQVKTKMKSSFGAKANQGSMDFLLMQMAIQYGYKMAMEDITEIAVLQCEHE